MCAHTHNTHAHTHTHTGTRTHEYSDYTKHNLLNTYCTRICDLFQTYWVFLSVLSVSGYHCSFFFFFSFFVNNLLPIYIYDLVWSKVLHPWSQDHCFYQGLAAHLRLSLDLLSILVGFVSLRITVPVTFWPALNTASSVSKRMSNASIFILNNSNQSHSHSSLPRAAPHLKQLKWSAG